MTTFAPERKPKMNVTQLHNRILVKNSVMKECRDYVAAANKAVDSGDFISIRYQLEKIDNLLRIYSE